jgi:formate/nitrite transporter
MTQPAQPHHPPQHPARDPQPVAQGHQPHHAPAAQPAPPQASFDAFTPAEMAQKSTLLGLKKTQTGFVPLFVLSVLAGAFIAFGAIFATVTAAVVPGTEPLPFGVVKLLMGVTFSLGLILVIVGGAELFTGNTLLTMSWAAGRISAASVLRNWTIVYTGNFVGAVGMAVLVFLSGEWQAAGGGVGLAALSIAEGKSELAFGQAVILGILCNILVCLAVWLSFSARTTTDRILAIVPPVAAFVAAGFEHSVANMYFLPFGVLVRTLAPEAFWTATATTAAAFPSVTWAAFAGNLIPVTLGNAIGGGLFVGAVYWLVYIRNGSPQGKSPSTGATPHQATKG